MTLKSNLAQNYGIWTSHFYGRFAFPTSFYPGIAQPQILKEEMEKKKIITAAYENEAKNMQTPIEPQSSPWNGYCWPIG